MTPLPSTTRAVPLRPSKCVVGACASQCRTSTTDSRYRAAGQMTTGSGAERGNVAICGQAHPRRTTSIPAWKRVSAPVSAIILWMWR